MTSKLTLSYNAPTVDKQNIIEESDRYWMQLALEQAKQAYELGEVPVGAVAVFDGQLIASGFNSKESKQDPTAHAELLVLRQAAESLNNWRLLNVILYSTLEPCVETCANYHDVYDYEGD